LITTQRPQEDTKMTNSNAAYAVAIAAAERKM